MAEAAAVRRAAPRHPAPGEPRLSALVVHAQRGDQDAFLSLYRTFAPRLLSYLRAMVGENDADDVASETWARVVADLHTFDAERSTFRSWATAIARHRAIDHLRRRGPASPRPPHLLPEHRAPNDTPDDAAERMSTVRAMRLLAELPPDQAQAVLLRVVIGLDARTAGRILRKRPGAVRTATHRGLRALASLLSPRHPDTARTAPLGTSGLTADTPLGTSGLTAEEVGKAT
ncbi:RNA polymerase sigma factor [Streptomyces sp. NPDC051940]|uniref:RNA polymerase sigma factor n=1 Tax=Streptomyces sp. NPDC051940 TaxID=3155675 RepID=UPI0034280935